LQNYRCKAVQNKDALRLRCPLRSLSQGKCGQTSRQKAGPLLLDQLAAHAYTQAIQAIASPVKNVSARNSADFSREGFLCASNNLVIFLFILSLYLKNSRKVCMALSV
jgi:hypothetical protein